MNRTSGVLYSLLLVLGLVWLGGLALDSVPATLSGNRPGVVVTETAPPSLTPLTRGDTLDGFPDWAPNGRVLLFMRNGDVWTMGSSGESPTLLSGKPGFWTISPVWSPDGNRVAFIRQEVKKKGLPASTIQVAGADGRNVQAVITEPANVAYLAWAPDSRRLAYTTTRAIRMVEVDEGEPRDLVSGSEGDYLSGGVDWTRDGRTIVFGLKDEVPDLWVYSFDTGQSRQLTTNGGIMPHISPDGRQVVYRDPTGETGIWVVPIEGGEPRVLVRDEKRKLYFHPRWSPDGSKVAVSALTIKDTGMTSGIWVFSP